MLEQQTLTIQQALGLALQHHSAGDLPKAGSIYHQILQADPNQPDALCLLGRVAYEIGNNEDAVDLSNKAVSIKPDNAEAHANLGNALKDLGRLDEAVASYHNALAISPGLTETHNNLGVALKNLGKPEEAVSSYHKALAIKPDWAEVHSNLGVALQDLRKLDEAVASYSKALAIEPDSAVAHFNLGQALMEQGTLDGAVANYDKAISIKPDYAEAYWNKSLALLLCGEFEKGWELHEWRHEGGSIPSRQQKFKYFRLEGAELKKQADSKKFKLDTQKLLVWMEQGVGDEIMFASLLPDLAQHIGTIVVECEKRLQPIFQRSFPEINFVTRMDPPSSKLSENNIDYQSSVADLGYFLRPDVNSFPVQNSYLCPELNKQNQIRNEYVRKWPGKLLVGISWRSGNVKNGKSRSLLLDKWAPLLSNHDCSFISLQYGDVEANLLDLKEATELDVYSDDRIDPLTDMDAFAAQVAALDIVISIDNSTVHMAGALGVPTWVLLPYVPDWRWLLDRDDSPWYPSVKLYRQKNIGDWSEVLNRVNSDLKNLVHGDTSKTNTVLINTNSGFGWQHL